MLNARNVTCSQRTFRPQSPPIFDQDLLFSQPGMARNREFSRPPGPFLIFLTQSLSRSPQADYITNPHPKKARKGPVFRRAVFLYKAASLVSLLRGYSGARVWLYLSGRAPGGSNQTCQGPRVPPASCPRFRGRDALGTAPPCGAALPVRTLRVKYRCTHSGPSLTSMGAASIIPPSPKKSAT